MQILNAPLIETSEKNLIFGDFLLFFLQLTIRPLQRFFITYLLFSIFCRNFALDFVTNYRGKSETSRGPRKQSPDWFWGKSEARVALMSAERSVGAILLPNAIEPAKVQLFFDMTKFFCKKMYFLLLKLQNRAYFVRFSLFRP